ncbi:MAG: PD40 domain-containing protein [candidate division Zixibacteria bacterium]|nr:PD40 domain-containing protein [candidate division Zixibacteria bacterium]
MRYFIKQTVLCSLSLLLLIGQGMSQEPYFGKNKVQYKSFEWHFIQTENFDIYYYKGEYHLAKFAADVLEDAYLKIKKELRYDLTKKVPVILYKSPNDFQQTNVIPNLIEESVGGFTESFKTRIVVPFTGSYEDYRHVLHHELTHAVTFDMLYGNAFGSFFSRQYLFQLPLWFAEGYAEYSSRGGWDIQADMVIRDATINGYLTPVELAGGYLVYKEGQSAIGYIVEKYGEEKLSEILNKGKSKLSMDKALKSAIGLDQKSFSEEWMKAQRKKYWPDIALREEAKEFAKKLTHHPEDGSYINEKPAFSPTGNRLAIFSDRSDYTEIYIISSIDGKVLKRLVKGERSGDLESLHSYVSGLSWSPDGKNLAFVSKSKGMDALCLIRVEDRKIYKKLLFPLDVMRSPSWSPDGKSIAFVGIKDGKTDLFMCHIDTQKLIKLTDDHYDDAYPSFSPDGRFIAFGSDRPVEVNADSSDYKYGHHNLFLLDLDSWRITPITTGEGNNTSPTWSPDGKKICFVSDRNGIYNLYVADLDSLAVLPITNVLSGCFSPSWSKDGDKIAFSAFQKGGWDIFLIKEITPAVREGDSLTKTPYLLTLEKDTIFTTTDTVQAEKPMESKLDFTSYVFKAGKSELDSLAELVAVEVIEEKDSISYRLPNGEYRERKYKLKFSADVISGALNYDTYFGFQGQSFIAVSDMLGNHTFILATDLVNTIDQSNFQIFYLYGARRLNVGGGILHTKYYYIDDLDRLFSDRLYGALAYLSFPFSKFTRAELNLTHISVDRKYYDLHPSTLTYDDRSAKVLLASLSWINDTVIWGHTSPINGSRSLFSYEYAPYITPRSITYGAAMMDYRRYFHFKKRYNFVFRLSGGFSHGDDKKTFFLGGQSNWIGPSLGSQNIYGINDLYFGNMVTPLRGYKYFDISGTKFFLTNLELRYPFVEHLVMRFPLPIILHYINGAMFYDMGAAWDENKKFKGGTSKGGTRLKDIKAGFGFGARANLGFFVLRYDVAWATDFSWVSPEPRHYLSLGAEF